VLKTPDAHDCFSPWQDITMFCKSPMNSGFMVIYFVHHSFYKLLIIWFLQSLLVIERFIQCHARLHQILETIDGPVVQRVDSMKTANGVCKS
jgi:hypothetical protein